MRRAFALLVGLIWLQMTTGDHEFFTGPRVASKVWQFPWHPTKVAVSTGLELNGRGDRDLAVVCVTHEGVVANITSVNRPCSTGKNFAEAQVICANMGLRLPSKEEVILKCDAPRTVIHAVLDCS